MEKSFGKATKAIKSLCKFSSKRQSYKYDFGISKTTNKSYCIFIDLLKLNLN